LLRQRLNHALFLDTNFLWKFNLYLNARGIFQYSRESIIELWISTTNTMYWIKLL